MPNAYRSIGGRANTSGVERVNRDGQMEKLQMGEAEVTPKERIGWYNKANLDPRGNLPEDFYKVEKDEAGNPMNVANDERTRLPRPHQYSTEARMVEARGEKAEFLKSEDTDDKAFGITPGMVLTTGDTRNAVVKDKVAAEKDAQKVIDERNKGQHFDGNNSNYPVKDASTRRAYASAFVKVAKILQSAAHLTSESVIHISDTDGLSVEDVLLLERVASNNKDLAKKYSQVVVKLPKGFSPTKKPIPGVKPENPNAPEAEVVKVSKEPQEELGKEELKSVSMEVGL